MQGAARLRAEAEELDAKANEKRTEAWESYLKAMEEVDAMEVEVFAKRAEATEVDADTEALAKAYRKKGLLIEAYAEDVTEKARLMRAETRAFLDAARELRPDLVPVSRRIRMPPLPQLNEVKGADATSEGADEGGEKVFG